MGQRQRFDRPGARHHVVNRGIGKRLMFAGRRDRRHFLSQLARAFRRNQLHVELYSLMGNHFHLIVRTDEGTLSEGMRRVQNGFSRWFNRRNRRDGPLVRARFRSRPIRSRGHLFAAIPYLDFNPVKAGLCGDPGEWEGGSARHYLADRYPAWLSVQRIRAIVAQHGRANEPFEKTYRRLFGSAPTPRETELVEQGFRTGLPADDDLDYLLEAPNERALRWIEAKARNADGRKPACALLPPSALEAAVTGAIHDQGPLLIKRSRKACDAWPLILFGLQNATAGMSCTALALRHVVSVSTASRYVCVHRGLLRANPDYARPAGLSPRRRSSRRTTEYECRRNSPHSVSLGIGTPVSGPHRFSARAPL